MFSAATRACENSLRQEAAFSRYPLVPREPGAAGGWGAHSPRFLNSGKRPRKQRCIGEETSSSIRRHREGGRQSRPTLTPTSIPGTLPPVIRELPASGSELGLVLVLL